ncbi:MAG: cation:proton antiporter [Gemmatimonadales bacterium]
MNVAVREFFASEPGYVLLLFVLFVVPRFLQRYRLPTAITSFALGALASLGFTLYTYDATLKLLSTFGIVALFLFAGLEVDTDALKRGAKIITQHLAIRLAMLTVGTLGIAWWLGLGTRPAALVSLALITPSAGFILDSLGRLGLEPEEQFWVKSKVIATEILALSVLFVALQSSSVSRLILASFALAAIIAILPWAFRIFAQRVAPYAPKSEFAFLIMMALLCAYATRQLGVYYLVGAFIVGLAARRFRDQLPAVASEQMLHAIEVFASFFAPFYFFAAGTSLHRDDFSVSSLALGLVFLAIAVPLRILSVTGHRGLVLKEDQKRSLRIATPMLPTLVFTLVIADILRDRFDLSNTIFGGLIIYTVCTTLIPGFLFGAPPPRYDSPELPPRPGGHEMVPPPLAD